MTAGRLGPRVALIGISGWAATHCRLLLELHDAGALKLVGCVVEGSPREAERIGRLEARCIPLFADYETMLGALSGQLELCVVPTGIAWHARMTIAALEIGANVLVEKPLTGSLADGQAIVAAARRCGRWVAVAYQDFYQPATLTLKQALVAGQIGRVESVRFLGLWPRPETYYRRNDWAGCLARQGVTINDSPLHNAMAHFVFMSLYFAAESEGEVAQVERLQGELFRAHDIESFDAGWVQARTTGGVELWFGASHVCRTTYEPEIRIQGSAGHAVWKLGEGVFIRPDKGEETQLPLVAPRDAQRAMLRATLDRLRGENACFCSAERALPPLVFIEALHRDLPIRGVPADQLESRQNEGEGEARWLAIPQLERQLLADFG